jgi:hypothetical protein
VAGIQWGSVADWVSGIGSFAAATVALYVARSSRRIKLRGYAGHRVIIGRGQPGIEVFSVSATNVSQRPTVVTKIGFTFGIWRWKRYGVITFQQDQISHGIPKSLGDGETADWIVPLGDDSQWLKDLASKFPISWWAVFTWRVHVHTSNGGSNTFRPDKAIREKLKAFADAPQRG